MTAFYNEWERYPAAWIRNLIAAGHVADGIVDERSIVELRATDLAATQCHFFAGIGGWSYALRLAGWPDDRPVWTASCPCQPFSTAGKGRGTDDERHLWPVVFELVRQCRPPILFGEQVASPAGRAWLDAVSADLESAGYAVGAANLCAAGVGAPHIRQRLYFVAVADADNAGVRERLHVQPRKPQQQEPDTDRGGATGDRMADADRQRCDGFDALDESRRRPTQAAGRSEVGGMANDSSIGRDERGMSRSCTDREGAGSADGFRLGDSDRDAARRNGRAVSRAQGTGRNQPDDHGPRDAGRDVLPAWSDAEWISCTDGKSRPAQPGSFPLADGVPGRVGKLRAYGNAIVPPLAATFIRAVMS